MTAPTKNENPRLLRSILLIAVLIAGGAGVASLLYAMREEPPRRELASPPPVVETVLIRAQEVTERFAGYGTALPDRTVNLAAEVASTVIELVDDIEAGSVVREGQVLARLDDREYRYALDRAEALAAADQAASDELVAEAQTLQKLQATAEKELHVARDERDRLTDLYERDLAAKKEYDFANLAYQRARRIVQGYEMELAKIGPRRARFAASQRSHQAEARMAELNIERCRITASFAGTIQELQIEVGDRVAPGSVLMTLIDPTHVEIPIQLPASVYSRVKIGAPCRVESETMSGIVWHGELARTAASADQQTRTFSVYVDVDNTLQDQPLIPGAFVRAEVQGPVYPGGILVPRAAIRDGRVLVVAGNVTEQRSVTITRLIGDQALVEGGVRSGDRVVLSNLDRLAPGSSVRVHATESASSHAGRSPDPVNMDSSP